MIIKFLTDSAFEAGLTVLFSHNFIFDLYRSTQQLKFFTEEMINNAETMLNSRSLTAGIDYIVTPYDHLV